MSHRSVSLARLASNRRSALKSTGPRTLAGKARSRMNAFRHGAYARLGPAVLAELGEDTKEYRYLLQQALESFPPSSPMERLLVEDIARLRWERRRLERAKDAKVRARLQAQENEWQRRLVEMEYEYNTAPPEQTLAFGLRRLKNSAAKFRDLLGVLEALEAQIDAGDFSAHTENLFRALWGVKPSVRGVEIMARFNALAKQGGLRYVRPEAACAAESGSSPAGGAVAPVSSPASGGAVVPVSSPASGGAVAPVSSPASGGDVAPVSSPASGGDEDIAATAGSEGAASPRTPEEEAARQEEASIYRWLRVAVMKEKRDVLVEQELFQKQRVPASRAAMDACLAPTEDGEWRLLTRWENTIDRQIERKMNLYLRLRGLAPHRPGRPPEAGARVRPENPGN